VIQAIRFFIGFLLWNLPVGVLLLFPQLAPPPLGLLLALAFTYWVLWRIVLRSGRPGEARRRATLQLRPLQGPALRWTLAAAPALLLLTWSVHQLYLHLVPVPERLLDPLAPYEALLQVPLGQLSLVVLAVGIAPVMEEFFFRGLIQRNAARRVGPAGGIAFASLLFALVHGHPWFFPLYVLLGAAFGFVVYATRSIWAGVLLHAANNSVAVLGTAVGDPAPPAIATAWEGGATPELWIALAALLLAAALAAYVARRLWRAGRGGRRERA
jgi:membrane protease YdiL (CAAX protease family)